MNDRLPCVTWAEKLVVRQEELSPPDRAALAEHLAECPACAAAAADYTFLIARIRSLPSPTVKPLPRLSPQLIDHEENIGEAQVHPHWMSSSTQVYTKRVRPEARRTLQHSIQVALTGLLVAGLLFASFVLFQPFHSTLSTHSSLPLGTTLLTYTGHTGGVLVVAWSPDGTRIASGDADGIVQVWDATTGKAIITHNIGHRVMALAWSPDGMRIASAGTDKVIQVWDATTGKAIVTYRGHTDIVEALAWSPDGMRIASVSYDKTIQVWNAATGKASFSHTDPADWMMAAVAWSPDGAHIVSADFMGNLQVWDAATGKAISTYTFLPQVVFATDLSWSPDDMRIAASVDEDNVQVWDVTTGKAISTYTGHTNSVMALAWSPDGTRIASASQDKTVQVWSAATGKAIITYTRHTEAVWGLAWSPDGTRIASASLDDTVQIWKAK